MRKNEFCIMPESPFYSVERFPNSHRHEVFFGSGRRELSIRYGLIVFLAPELHNMSSAGVHFNRDFDLLLKRIGQQAAMEHYDWTAQDFIAVFGRNYLEG